MKKRLQLNVAVAMFQKLESPRREFRKDEVTGIVDMVQIKEDEKELSQFFIDFKQLPISPENIKIAFADLQKMVLHEMERAGLLK